MTKEIKEDKASEDIEDDILNVDFSPEALFKKILTPEEKRSTRFLEE